MLGPPLPPPWRWCPSALCTGEALDPPPLPGQHRLSGSNSAPQGVANWVTDGHPYMPAASATDTRTRCPQPAPLRKPFRASSVASSRCPSPHRSDPWGPSFPRGSRQEHPESLPLPAGAAARFRPPGAGGWHTHLADDDVGSPADGQARRGNPSDARQRRGVGGQRQTQRHSRLTGALKPPTARGGPHGGGGGAARGPCPARPPTARAARQPCRTWGHLGVRPAPQRPNQMQMHFVWVQPCARRCGDINHGKL